MDVFWRQSASRGIAFCVALGALMVLVPAGSGAMAGTLDDVRKRGILRCGVSEGLPGFSAQGKDNRWRGFDVDFCRALAAAVLDDPEKIEFVPLSATARFDALARNEIDVLSRNTTWTLQRDVVRDLEFLGISYYDGQGFMTRRSNGLSSALQMAGVTVCVLAGTTSEANAKRFLAAKKVEAPVKLFEARDDLLKAYDAGQCDAYSADMSGLASDRQRLREPDEHMLLPEVISKEPLGPVVRQGDPRWADVGRWVLNLLVNAEEVGWTKAAAASGSDEPPLSVSKEISDKLGLDPDWPVAVVKAVGNYGEIFERNVGSNSPLELPRGVNALWTRGGILYAPPMR
jgi:general L-amino acid transport system substrate-binding protein